MRVKIFTVYDCKAEAYMDPFASQSAGTAIRMFERMCNDEKSVFCRNAEDFTLFECGEFDTQKGEIFPHKTAISLVRAIELKKSNPVAVQV